MATTPNIIVGDLQVTGSFSAQGGVLIPAGTITDAMVNTGAAISASKLQHDQRVIHAQDSATAATSQSHAVYAVLAAGGATVVLFEAWAITPCVGVDTVSVDLKKNGTTILTTPISLTVVQSARQTVTATFASTSLAQNDILEVVITPNHTAGTLAAGVGCCLQIKELSQ